MRENDVTDISLVVTYICYIYLIYITYNKIYNMCVCLYIYTCVYIYIFFPLPNMIGSEMNSEFFKFYVQSFLSILSLYWVSMYF